MAASKSSTRQLLDVIQKHVPEERIEPLLDDLTQISGNRSLTDTITILHLSYRAMKNGSEVK